MNPPSENPLNAVSFLLDRHAEGPRQNRTAVLQPGRSALTYAQLNGLVAQLSHHFRRRGVGAGQPVGLLMPDSQELAVALLACLKLGAIAVPLNTFVPETTLRQFLIDCPRPFLVTSPHYTSVPAGFDLEAMAGRHLSVAARELADLPQHCPTEDVEAQQAAIWLYTSGSTGQPKAVVHGHSTLLACLDGYPKHVLGMTEDDCFYSTSKVFFAYGLGNSMLFPLAAGARVLLDPQSTNPGRVLHLVSEFRPSLFFSVPSVYQRLLDLDTLDAQSFIGVRQCLSAGEYLPAPLFREWKHRTGIDLLDGLGTTEMLHIFCSNRPGDIEPGTSGKPLPGYHVDVVDEHGQSVPDQTVGQLMVHGPSSDPRPNPKDPTRLTPGPVCRLTTGDLYWRNERGNLVYAGRHCDSFKVAGMWVTPVEIEQLLMAQPGVTEAAVIPARSSQGLQVVKAFVATDLAGPHQAASDRIIADLLHALSSALPRHKIPAQIELLERLPRTATGKVDRRALREQEMATPETPF